jgi:hypothetical protein
MDKAEILALMISAETRVDSDWDALLCVYADRLARIAPKLTDDELYPLLAVGSAVYRRWCQQTDAEKAAADVLLKIKASGG